MNASRTVSVRLAHAPYNIEICRGGLAKLGEWVSALRPVEHAVVLTDSHVAGHFAVAAQTALQSNVSRVDCLEVPAGEASKSVAQAMALWEQLLALKADRKTVIVALGGGVIGDLAGFIAATFARGLDFVQVPTTLLADVDSSVGGKTGINLANAKNMVGVFWQPKAVMIDLDLLKTLPSREYKSGLAEVVKYGIILDAAFFELLEREAGSLVSSSAPCLAEVVATCCEIKARVVEQDEREETGLRAVLNYGHTFAHAVEVLSGYGTLLHGEAVAIGMRCAAELARRLGRVDGRFVRRQTTLLAALHLPQQVPAALTAESALGVMATDKKAAFGQLRFVLPTRLGHVELAGGVPSNLVAEVWQDCKAAIAQ